MNIHEAIKQSGITINLAYPVMLSQLGQVLVGVADSIMVGQLGKEPLAAASLGNSIFVLFLTFGIGISYGITPLVAKADGEKDNRTIMDLLSHGFVVNSGTGLLLLGLLYLTSFILPLLDQPPLVVMEARPYFLIISVSIIPFMVFQTFRQFAEGLSFTRQAMVITVSGNLINIALNYLLIFGKLGLPALGLTGAGIATLLARVIMAVTMAGFIYYEKRFKPYWAEFNPTCLARNLVRRILSIGLPSGFQFIFEVGAFSLAAIMVGWLGTTALAAHQIAISLASITYMMASGLATATTIRVGNQWGRRDVRMLRYVGFTGFLISMVFMGTAAILLILFKSYLPALYIDDKQVIELSTRLIIIAAFFQVSDGLQVIGLGALRGMADVRIPTLVTLFAYWVLALPIGYLLGIKLMLGAQGIWIGLLTGLTVTAVLLIIRFNLVSKKLIRMI